MKIYSRLIGLAVAFAGFAGAQTTEIRTGSYELGLFTGATYGVSKGAAMGGANVSYAVYKWFLPYVEYSYFPGIEHTISGFVAGDTSRPFHGTFPARASDFHGGIHFRWPIRETRLAPYAAIGVGVLSIGDGELKKYTVTNSFGPQEVTVNQTVPVSGSSLAVNFGGGLRYYVTPAFGLRVEAKGYKPMVDNAVTKGLGVSTLDNMFLKAEVGIFFQFR